MSFTNDMPTPIMIRGYRIRGGYVRYEIWGIPDGRKVTISQPAVSNVQQATTKIVYTSTLAPGVRKQTEWPANGMSVWRTRTVTKNGHVIHHDTYYSRYRLWNGIIQVGKAR
jgi:vancomycin resistance protein YoaR